MKDLPHVGWLLVFTLALLALSGLVLIFLAWSAKTEALTLGLIVTCLNGVCLIGVSRRMRFARYLAVIVVILTAAGLTAASIFLVVVGQQEQDVMGMARTGLLTSLLLVGFALVVFFSRNLRNYFAEDIERVDKPDSK